MRECQDDDENMLEAGRRMLNVTVRSTAVLRLTLSGCKDYGYDNWEVYGKRYGLRGRYKEKVDSL